MNVRLTIQLAASALEPYEGEMRTFVSLDARFNDVRSIVKADRKVTKKACEAALALVDAVREMRETEGAGDDV